MRVLITSLIPYKVPPEISNWGCSNSNWHATLKGWLDILIWNEPSASIKPANQLLLIKGEKSKGRILKL